MTRPYLPLVFTLIAGSVAHAACSADRDDTDGASGGSSPTAGSAPTTAGGGGQAAAGEGGVGVPLGAGGRGGENGAGEGGQTPNAGGLGGAETAGAGGAATGGAPALTVQLGADGRLEGIDDAGAPRTLYFHGRDLPSSPAAPAASRCTEACEATWLPFHVSDIVVGEGLSAGDFAELARDDGQPQTTYRGWPVYTYASDTEPEDREGEGADQLWHAATEPFPTLILMRQSAPQDSGLYLADAAGRTLYRLLGDEPGTAGADPISTCITAGCKKAWPVFAPARVNPVSSLDEEITIFIRPDDGGVQLAYDGSPLYYFAQDTLPGDLLGVGKPSWVLATP